MLFKDESDKLKRSAWPVCDQLAASLAQRGSSAIPALEAALAARAHHVRSAALRAIQSISPDLARVHAERALKDRAYEVRETAANILGVDPPK